MSDERTVYSDGSSASLVRALSSPHPGKPFSKVVGSMGPFFRKFRFLRSEPETVTEIPLSRSTATRGPASDPDDYGKESEYSSSNTDLRAPKSIWHIRGHKQSRRHLGDSSGSFFNRPMATNSVFAVVITAVILLCSGALLYIYVNWSNDRFLHLAKGRFQSPIDSKEVVKGGMAIPPVKSGASMPGMSGPHSEASVVDSFANDTSASTTGANSEPTPPALFLNPLASKDHVSGKLCISRFCLAHSSYLEGYLDWNVDPCTDFYGFVCSRDGKALRAASSDAYLSDQMERVLFQTVRGDSRSDMIQGKRKEQHTELLEDCLKNTTPKSTRRQFRELLEDMGLGHWPYRNNKGKVDVWKVAATLIRDLQLETLMSVDIETDVTGSPVPTVVVDEPDLLIGQYGSKDRRLPRWYTAALVTCFKIFMDTDENSTIKGVKELSEKLAEITSSRGQESFFASRYRLTTVSNYIVYKPLVSFIMRGLFTVRDNTRLLVKSDRFLRALKSVLQMTKSSDLLNFFGFRVLIHVSPFMNEDFANFYVIRMRQVTGQKLSRPWPRWKRCLRVLEPLYQSLYILTYSRFLDAKIEMEKMVSLGNEIKSHMVVSIAKLPWLSSADKVKSMNIVSSVRIRFFYPQSFKKLREYLRSQNNLPSSVSGRFLHSYKEGIRKLNLNHYNRVLLHEARSHERLPWKGSVFNTYPTFDVTTGTIYVPMAIVDLSELSYEDSFGVQVPRISSRIIMTLLQAAHQRSYPFGQLEWSLNSSVALHDTEVCLASQYRNVSYEMTAEKIRNSLTAAYNFLDNTVISPAFEVFQKYLRDRRVDVRDTGALRGLTTRHLFYILFAAGLCEKNNLETIRKEFGEDTYSQPRLRVNVPLQNSPKFSSLWNCSVNAAMNPRKKCLLWAAGN